MEKEPCEFGERIDIGDPLYLKRYQALLLSFERVKAENLKLSLQINILEMEKKQWELEKAKQVQVIQGAIAKVNAQSNAYLEENKSLKEEIKRLKGGG